MLKSLQEKIIQLKKETDTCILAHSYMTEEICEIADFVGDSFALSVKAKSAPQKRILMCGVRFMADTVKMLSPQKEVILSHAEAGCPMAEQFDKATILALKEQYPDHAVVAYVNTTTELKTVADVCVTSSSAVKICREMPEQNIIFIPDINLGTYVKEQVPEKNFVLMQGGCPRHAMMTKEDVLKAKSLHPNALFLVHPECPKAVVELADYVGSTAGIMEFAKKSTAKEFIIGTENAIVQHLQLACPNQKFYALSKNLICPDMKITTLQDVYDCLTGEGGEVITMEEEVRQQAVKSIEKMIAYGG